MSSRQKGGRSRRKVQRYLEKLGYLVSNVEKSGSRYLKERDLFALSQDGEFSDKGFDLIALGDGNVVFVQVKSNKPAVKSFYESFSKMYCDGYIEVLVATVIDYKGIRLQWYEPDGTITEGFVDSSEVPSKSA